MLLEDIPDHLNGADIALALAQLHRLVQPPDRRSERGAPDLDQAFLLHLTQGAPDRCVTHVLHLDVVKLEDVDVIGLQPLETLVDGKAHVVAVELLRQLALSTARSLRLWIIDVVADFGRVDDFVPAAAERRGELSLAAPIPVGVGSIEEVDAVDGVRGAQHLDRLVVGFFPPPTGREGPRAEADLAGADVGAGKLPVAHRQIGWRRYQVNRAGAGVRESDGASVRFRTANSTAKMIRREVREA